MRIQALLLFVLSLTLTSTLYSSEINPVESQDISKQIEELDQSLDMLKRWQKQYTKTLKNQKRHQKRILFRNRSPKDAQKSIAVAQEAQQNAQEIQIQIDELIAKKELIIAQQDTSSLSNVLPNQ